MASVSLSERQAAQMDLTVPPPGGDRRVDPGFWSAWRRSLLNSGVAAIPGNSSSVSVTLPAPMPSASYFPQATIVNDAGMADAMANSPGHVVVRVDSASQITISLVSVLGAPALVPNGETLNVHWCVRE